MDNILTYDVVMEAGNLGDHGQRAGSFWLTMDT